MCIPKNRIIFCVPIFVMLFLNACKNANLQNTNDDAEVLVQVFDDASVSALEEEFTRYQFQKIEVVSRPMHIYLFKFNSEKIKLNEFIELLKTSDLVKEAQRNGKVELRK